MKMCSRGACFFMRFAVAVPARRPTESSRSDSAMSWVKKGLRLQSAKKPAAKGCSSGMTPMES